MRSLYKFVGIVVCALTSTISHRATAQNSSATPSTIRPSFEFPVQSYAAIDVSGDVEVKACRMADDGHIAILGVSGGFTRSFIWRDGVRKIAVTLPHSTPRGPASQGYHPDDLKYYEAQAVLSDGTIYGQAKYYYHKFGSDLPNDSEWLFSKLFHYAPNGAPVEHEMPSPFDCNAGSTVFDFGPTHYDIRHVSEGGAISFFCETYLKNTTNPFSMDCTLDANGLVLLNYFSWTDTDLPEDVKTMQGYVGGQVINDHSLVGGVDGIGNLSSLTSTAYPGMTCVMINDQDQAIFSQTNAYISLPGTEGFLLENGSVTYLRDIMPEKLKSQIATINPRSLSNQKKAGSTNPDASITIVADVKFSDKTSRPVVCKRDKAGVWSVRLIELPDNIFGTRYGNVTPEGKIVAIGTTSLVSTVKHVFLLAPCDLLVDANRDGYIKYSGNATDEDLADKEDDVTSKDKPFRFWVNDDCDTFSTNGTKGQEAVNFQFGPDSSIGFVHSQRDLEDYARLWICIGKIDGAVTAGALQIGLKWKTIFSGHPSIKIVASVDPNGSDSYMKDEQAAFQQTVNKNGFAIVDKNNNSEIGSDIFVFTRDSWNKIPATNTTKYFIFEGVTEGKGQLEIVFLDNQGNLVGEGGSLWVDLKNIKKMYQRGYAQSKNKNLPYSYTDTVVAPNIALAKDPNANQKFEQAWDEEPQSILITHGFNVTYKQSTNSAETVFKRLWWRGYKGRFAAFRWALPDGILNGRVPEGAVGTYNDQQYFAWNSGDAFKQFVDSTLPSNYATNIVAHSMGNYTVGEAMRNGMKASHYAMLHAATPACCYSNENFSYQTSGNGQLTADTDQDPGTRNLAYTGWLKSIGGKPINFYDVNDSVVRSVWDVNNRLFKPQRFTTFSALTGLPVTSGYYYNRTADVGHRLGITFLLSVGRFVTDPAEAKAFVDYSITGSIGGANRNTQSQGGAILDSQDDSSFGNEHSSEWERNIQDPSIKVFYYNLLRKFDIKQSFLDPQHPST